MILTDFSQIISASILVPGDCNVCAKNPSTQSKKLIKHFIINSVRANFMAHKAQYGKMIIACDSGSWRYDVFPQYKHERKLKLAKDDSGINWSFVSELKEELIEEMRMFLPFSVISVPKGEGDDVIGVLTKLITEKEADPESMDIFGDYSPEKILIISSDIDNYQLHEYKNVKQWSPMMKKLVKPDGSARNALIEKIVKGDRGDGVMNIRMRPNTFVDGIRQKPISQKFLDGFFASKNPIDMCESDEQKENYIRNEELVSYKKIPKDISESIILCYNEQSDKKHSKMKLMNYFIANDMTNLLSQIHDFY
jgi:hypothetical protein